MDLVLRTKPDQCTLVPDPPGILTSNTGWNTSENLSFLIDIVQELKEAGIRVSLFLNADMSMVESVGLTGTDRIELYTGEFAKSYINDKEEAIRSHIEVSKSVNKLGIGVNAGHDLNLVNLKFYKENMPYLKEVSIGHALIADSLKYGLKNTIQLYLNALS
ncbi:UNVERIFIED_CONTAM: hypothetical protein GTU68_067283 [Idotea baltica]|nr:hypothetical protein [Idotea baltica]